MFKRIVIICPEKGIYLGNCMGMGFFTLLDPVGQPVAVVFETQGQAAQHILGWDSANRPDDYRFVPVDTANDRFATIPELKAAGLGDLLGTMEAEAAQAAADLGLEPL
jgi:hypothetical protein